MKALLFLFAAVAVGFAAYNYAYDPVLDAFGISKHRPQPKVEVAKKEEPKPEPKPEPKLALPADFAFAKLTTSAQDWNLMLATDQVPVNALFTEPGSLILASRADVIMGLGGKGLKVKQSPEAPAGVTITGVGYERAGKAGAASGDAMMDSKPMMGDIKVKSGVEQSFEKDGMTTVEYKDGKPVKKEITGMATITALGAAVDADAHPSADAPKGWMWTAEPVACYRAGKLLGIWDPAAGKFREAAMGEAPSMFDFDGASAPVIAAVAESKPKAPEPEKPKEGEFVPPKFDPIEVVTANWTKISPSVFRQPKQVTIAKEMEFEIKVGAGTAKQKVAAGGIVFAFAQDGANILVAPTAISPARVPVPLEDTNLKEIVTAAYEQYIVAETERQRQAFEEKKIAALNPSKKGGAGSAAAIGVGAMGRPEKAPDGTYPLLLASMKSGQVTEIKPENIKSWGDPKQEDIDKVKYWTVVVKYETQTMFGKFETEAQARVKDGKVDKWVYVGSGEVVP